MKFLIVVDMQKDFIDGALGTAEAVAILPAVKEKIRNFDGRVIFTRDTHEADYLSTQEGKNLPVEHCICGSDGWQIHPELDALRKEEPIDKPTFGSVALAHYVAKLFQEDKISGVELIGLCTDICVMSNAILLKAAEPELKVSVDASCCAGVTPQSHRNALEAMKMCQVEIVGE